MNGLEIILNGQTICTAGAPHTIVGVTLHRLSPADEQAAWIIATGAIIPPPRTSNDLAPKLRAALQHPEPQPPMRHAILLNRDLKIGDEITIRLIEQSPDFQNPVNPPTPIPDPTSESN